MTSTVGRLQPPIRSPATNHARYAEHQQQRPRYAILVSVDHRFTRRCDAGDEHRLLLNLWVRVAPARRKSIDRARVLGDRKGIQLRRRGNSK